ncbi:mitochondrial 2-oxoglutarate/malate carrier protein isoform X1 [Cephus cinctus]|uniref:Mitochondrial 2-oxoglutarate/malate carrier protein isoform X1 n=1 Tax=Cephus cinctus TaxID=211228 RepID=A0AAJ7FL88_CEPCN|nr:mitochondrial 2-oxoglutarate/malate carrier protein isoform X1 [Cephus cinctus]XP_024943551.1 mitochondrial 2-oxoglutarate/malate carrier protein isoform X1 [Cephus cinctus]
MSDKKSDSGDKSSKGKPQSLPPGINFLNAGLSGMFATCFVHPMDVIKNRMQMSKDPVGVFTMVSRIFKNEGITKFYAGLSAGLLRQATYTTTRLGIYNQLLDIWRSKNTENPNFGVLAAMGIVAGACGAFVGTPAEVALVRMTSDGRLPADQRRNYKNVLDAFIRICKEEGVTNLWRGSVATMGRAAIVNMSQLATYSQAKNILASKYNVKDGIPLHFSASMISGFVTAFNSMPFDIAKTRIQNMKSSGKTPSMMSIIYSIVKTEGVISLWRGFWPTYCRIGPHTVLTFIFNEQFAKFYRQTFM